LFGFHKGSNNLVFFTLNSSPFFEPTTTLLIDVVSKQTTRDTKYRSAEWKPVKMILKNGGSLVLISGTDKEVWSSQRNSGKCL